MRASFCSRDSVPPLWPTLFGCSPVRCFVGEFLGLFVAVDLLDVVAIRAFTLRVLLMLAFAFAPGRVLIDVAFVKGFGFAGFN